MDLDQDLANGWGADLDADELLAALLNADSHDALPPSFDLPDHGIPAEQPDLLDHGVPAEQPDLLDHDVPAEQPAGVAEQPADVDLEHLLDAEPPPLPDIPQDDVDMPDAEPDQDEQTNGVDGDDILETPNDHLRPIEVILSPPVDPESYERIPLSWAVERIMEELLVEGEVIYNVEYQDGRIEEANYEDVIYCAGGEQALQTYHRHGNGDVNSGKSQKRSYADDDDYEESDSEAEGGRRSRHRPVRVRLSHSSQDAYLRNDFRRRVADHDREQSDGDHLDMDIDSAAKPRQLRERKALVRADSGDELAKEDAITDDDEDAFMPVIRSDLAPATRMSKRNKTRLVGSRASARAKTTRTGQRTVSYKQQYASDSEIEFEPSRRSGRSNRNKRSMRDPEVDEFDLIEEKVPAAIKHAATKEIFKPLDPESDFVRFHMQICQVCGNESGGHNAFVYCQGCSFSIHRACLGYRGNREHRVTKIGDDDFVLQCKHCIGLYKTKDARAPDHSLCQSCKVAGKACAAFAPKKTPKQEEKARLENDGIDPVTKVRPGLVNNFKNVLFRCRNCKRGYHFPHLPPITAAPLLEDPVEDLLSEYSLREWNCKTCLDNPSKLDGLYAWRPADESLRGAASEKTKTITDYDEDGIEYLVKWDQRSHFHDSWMSGAWVHGVAHGTMRVSFLRRDEHTYPRMDFKSAIEEDWLIPEVLLNVLYHTRKASSTKEADLARIDDIRSIYVKFQGLSYEEVVWDDPPPRDSGAPWEGFCAAYHEYLNGKYFESVSDTKMRERISNYRSLDFGKDCELKEQPAQLRQGKLMEYQMEGVNFLLYNFHQQQNVILADEMGLGKTVQIVAFISALTHTKPGCWPFLIVVPNSTCGNWRRELKTWAPDLRVVAYYGGKTAQQLAYTHELYPGSSDSMKAHVVIMSYEAAANIGATFRSVRWVGLVVDEGQRLKNEETNLYKSLSQLKIPCRILLTGTPLQNNTRELFNLLQFIDPKRNAQALDDEYAVLNSENLTELHNLIRPYFLRRTKAQVLKFLPGMSQIIVPVTMTVLQEKLSKSIMSRDPDLIKAILSSTKVKASDRKSLNNMLSDLRQLLCHPFCFDSQIEDRNVDPLTAHRNLVAASAKLLLLDIMLPILKERGHRVLIFSQFLHSLTIIEDFLTGLGLAHARIDGNMSALVKQKKIDAYNAPDSELFAMLLSTRAGGVGINLATADTVIIFDPDFNPHQDIQAISRAHRIGQKRPVICMQLMTKNTAEEKIMQAGRRKMALDHALIGTMDATDETPENLESILAHGAAALFSDQSVEQIVYDRASVEKLLDRSEIENTGANNDQNGEAQSADNQFSFAKIWENKKGDLGGSMDLGDEDDDNKHADKHELAKSVWESILKEREIQHAKERAAQQVEYGRGQRRAAKASYHLGRTRDLASDGEEEPTDDELYIDHQEPEEDDDEEGDAEEYQGPAASSTSRRKASVRQDESSQANLPPSQLRPPPPVRKPAPQPTRPANIPQQSLPARPNGPALATYQSRALPSQDPRLQHRPQVQQSNQPSPSHINQLATIGGLSYPHAGFGAGGNHAPANAMTNTHAMSNTHAILKTQATTQAATQAATWATAPATPQATPGPTWTSRALWRPKPKVTPTTTAMGTQAASRPPIVSDVYSTQHQINWPALGLTGGMRCPGCHFFHTTFDPHVDMGLESLLRVALDNCNKAINGDTERKAAMPSPAEDYRLILRQMMYDLQQRNKARNT